MSSQNDELQLPSISGEGSSLPAVSAPSTPDLYDSVGAGDIQLPSVYLQQALSKGVQGGVAKAGDVILALGADDPAPIHLIGGPEERKSFDAYIIASKRVFTTTANGRLEFLPERDFTDRDCWEGFNYLLSIPEVDEVVPARMLLTRTAGRIASKRINFFIQRDRVSAADGGTPPPTHVRFTVGTRSNRNGQEYFVLGTEALPPGDDVEVAIAMREYAKFMQRNLEDAA